MGEQLGWMNSGHELIGAAVAVPVGSALASGRVSFWCPARSTSDDSVLFRVDLSHWYPPRTHTDCTSRGHFPPEHFDTVLHLDEGNLKPLAAFDVSQFAERITMAAARAERHARDQRQR